MGNPLQMEKYPPIWGNLQLCWSEIFGNTPKILRKTLSMDQNIQEKTHQKLVQWKGNVATSQKPGNPGILP